MNKNLLIQHINTNDFKHEKHLIMDIYETKIS